MLHYLINSSCEYGSYIPNLTHHLEIFLQENSSVDWEYKKCQSNKFVAYCGLCSIYKSRRNSLSSLVGLSFSCVEMIKHANQWCHIMVAGCSQGWQTNTGWERWGNHSPSCENSESKRWCSSSSNFWTTARSFNLFYLYTPKRIRRECLLQKRARNWPFSRVKTKPSS